MTLLKAVFLLTLFPLISVAEIPDQITKSGGPDGKLLVQLNVEKGDYEVVSLTVVPNVTPVETNFGEEVYRLLDRNGDLLHTGRIHLQKFIVYEYADENGDFHGTAEPFEGSAKITIPYYKSAWILEIQTRDRIIRRELDDIRTLKSSVPNVSPTTSKPPDFRGYLRDLEASRLKNLFPYDEISPASESPSGKKTKVKGTVTVEGVEDYSLVRAEVSIYLRGGSEEDPIAVTSDSNGNFKAKLASGVYLILATCYYKDPTLGGQEVLLYPNPLIISDFRPKAGKIELNWELNQLFRGRLMAKGFGEAKGEIYILDGDLSGSTYQKFYISNIQTDEEGSFAIRLPRKRYAMILLPSPELPVGEKLKIVKVKKSKKVKKLYCPQIGEVYGDPLKKIWDSGPNDTRLNYVFLAEGYTDIVEQFTDENGNGYWDGDILFDWDGDGERKYEERYYDRNGNSQWDVPEPFEDTNGDSICNRYERAKFEADCAVNTATVLNFTPFDEFDDCINVYTYWITSRHGVQRLSNYPAWQNMETAYNAAINPYGAAVTDVDLETLANQLVPNAREAVPILLVHDPICIVRGYNKGKFGRIVISAEGRRGGRVLIHELGHNVGQLFDEYTSRMEDFSSWADQYPTENYANVTTETDPTKVKWKKYFDGTPPVPTPFGYDGYGVFEGAWCAYGIYRPTYNSMMRSTYYPFFKVNADQLRKVLNNFKE